MVNNDDDDLEAHHHHHPLPGIKKNNGVSV